MASTDHAMCVTLEAGQDLSSNQFHFVAVAADGQIDPAGAGVYAEGVLMNAPSAAGQAAEVAIGGIVKVVCGGTVTRGGAVASDASGQCVDATTGNIILGTALDAGAAGEVVRVLLHQRGAA